MIEEMVGEDQLQIKLKNKNWKKILSNINLIQH